MEGEGEMGIKAGSQTFAQCLAIVGAQATLKSE